MTELLTDADRLLLGFGAPWESGDGRVRVRLELAPFEDDFNVSWRDPDHGQPGQPDGWWEAILVPIDALIGHVEVTVALTHRRAFRCIDSWEVEETALASGGGPHDWALLPRSGLRMTMRWSTD